MQKKNIEILTKNILTDYWNGKLPVKVDKLIEDLNITIKKDMMIDSSGLVEAENGEVKCIINVMHSEEVHRFAMACAIGYVELNLDNINDIKFDVIKDFSKNPSNEEDKVWQAVKFAEYLLMPEESVRKEVEEGKKEGITPSFSHLYYSKEFKVPEQVVKARFEELGI